MEAIQVTTPTAETGANVKKQKHQRIPKPKGEQLARFPNARMHVTSDNQGEAYSIAISLMVPGKIGNPEAATRCYEFANNLDQQAKQMNIGEVSSVAFGNSQCDAVLTLNVREKPGNVWDPAARAFEQLKGFIDSAEILRGCSWKAKVKNTTIVEGRF